MDERERRALARAAAAARPIGAFSASALDPAARARGFATAALLAEWPSIVGAELAQFTIPDRVVWPRHQRDESGETVRHQGRKEDGAILILRVDGPRAIEVQYRSRQILERVNGHFGYRAVAEMRILQAPVTRKPAPARPAQEAIEPAALPPSASIEDDGLREALMRLGSAPRPKP
ncbi:MAG: DUF721 domain-containing protein [Methyloceanibacter sp.]